MTLNTAQHYQLVENYVSHIIDGMDVDTLASMVYDLLVREYETYTEEQIVGEIEELYGEEVAADLVESASAV
jgi:tetrahydromethanopterin S-methyltransferase subunit A